MLIDSISLRKVEKMNDLDTINERIENLILIPNGMLPGNRGFGLPRNFVDANRDAAINIIAAELAEKVAEYIPEIEIREVDGAMNKNGGLELRISVGRSG